MSNLKQLIEELEEMGVNPREVNSLERYTTLCARLTK
jgi:hypothetical protein